MNMILFIAFAFEFFIRQDQFLGAVLVFNGIINLLAYQQAPRKIASITVILNLFNAFVCVIVSYNYGTIDYSTLFIVWTILAVAYSFASLRQFYNLIVSRRSKKKLREKVS